MTTPKHPPVPSIPKASPHIPSVPMLPRGKPYPVDAPVQDEPSGDSPSADTTPMKFELAMTQEEIYSSPNPKLEHRPSTSSSSSVPAPPPVAEPEPVVEAPPPPVPAGPPGLLLARRRQSASQRLMSHPIIWPTVGAVASLLVGFLAALWISGSLLTSDVKTLTTERAILMKTPTEQRDARRIAGLDAKISDARSSVAWKCGGLWTLVFAAGLFTWTRVFRE